jgi:hypothetical protein
MSDSLLLNEKVAMKHKLEDEEKQEPNHKLNNRSTKKSRLQADTETTEPQKTHFDELLSLSLLNSQEVSSDDHNLPYIHCNETGQKATLDYLSSIEKNSVNPRVHIGFSVWFNLDIIAATKPDFAIILDIDHKVHRVYESFSVLKDASNPNEFKELFFSQLQEKKILSENDLMWEQFRLEEELKKDHGFLADTEAFAYIKSMYLAEKIFFGHADLASKNDIQLIKTWCDQNQAIVQTLYLSNIMEWVIEYNLDVSSSQCIKANVDFLKSQHTIIIDAFYPTLLEKKGGPPLRYTLGELPDFTKKTRSSSTFNKSKQLRFIGHSDKSTSSGVTNKFKKLAQYFPPEDLNDEKENNSLN